MSVLTQSGRIDRMAKSFVAENVIAERRTPGSSGGFTCRCCGNLTHSIADMSYVIGVGTSTLSKWLRREPIRQDIADKIRKAFFRVVE